MELTKKQKAAAFKLSYAMAIVHSLALEEKEKSRLHSKLSNLEEHLGRVLDEYRIQHFQPEDLDKASLLFDILDEKILEMFGEE